MKESTPPSPEHLAELEEQGRQLEALLQATPNGIVSTDLDGRITLCNKRAGDMFGIDPGTAIGSRLDDLFPDDCRQHLDRALATVLASVSSQVVEAEPVLPDGRRLPLEIHIGLQEEEPGHPLGYCLVMRDISKQRHVERGLRQSEEQLRRIIDVLPQCVCYVNADLTYRYANPSAMTLFGLTPEELVGRTTTEVIGTAAHDQIRPYLERVLSGKTARYQRDLLYPDGKVHCIDGCLIPDRDEDGTVCGYFAVLYDITHIKKTHEELREKDEKIRSIFRVAPIGIGVTAQRMLLDVNERLCKMLGYGRDELIGRSSRLLYPSDEEHQTIGNQRREQIALFGSSSLETRMQRRDGSIITALTNATPIDPTDLEAGIIFTVLDISESKQTEQMIRSHSATLDAIFNSTPSILILVDEDGRVEKINNRGIEFFGTDRDRATHLLCGLLFRCINASDTQTCGHSPECPSCPVRSRLTATFRSRRPAREEEGRMTFLRDGRYVLHHLLISTEIITIEGVDRVLVALTDISDIRKKDQELLQQRLAHEQLEQQYRQAQKMEPVGRLAGGIAHDLNNLLAPILGYSELLTQDLVEDDPRRAALEQILYAGQRARDLIRQLLAFSRKQTLTVSTIHLNDLLQQFHNLLRRAIREDIEISLRLADGLPAIQGDSGQLEQVILNLAVNAQDAMPTGGVLTLATSEQRVNGHALTELDLADAGPYVLLTVADTGIGMDPTVRSQIFEPFFTTKDQHSGTGLGLSTVYGIVKQHRGAITVASEPANGTSFSIYLPVSEVNAVAPAATAESTDEVLMGSETILLAEDDPHLRHLAEAILRKNGYTVLSASNGKEAMVLAEIHQGPIDLLVADVVMPEMNGRELCEQLSRSRAIARVLFMSGYADDVLSLDYLKKNGFEFIHKPFTVKDLLTRIRTMLHTPQVN